MIPGTGAKRAIASHCEDRPIDIGDHIPVIGLVIVPARINILQGVVQAVGVAVVRLAVAGGLNDRVGAEEAAQPGIIHPAVHVDQAENIQVLVAVLENVIHRVVPAVHDIDGKQAISAINIMQFPDIITGLFYLKYAAITELL